MTPIRMKYLFPLFLFVSACSMSDLVNVDPPTDEFTPGQINNPAGALGLGAGALKALSSVYGGTFNSNDIRISGSLTDELRSMSIDDELDSRNRMDADALFRDWNTVRMQSNQAIGAMRRFPNEIPDASLSRIYSVAGYSELILAERFCSGIPLNVIPIGGGSVHYSPARSTDEVLEVAIAHFDTALSLAGDSARFRDLARVGKARALLMLGKFAEAQSTVNGVLPGFVYNVEFSATGAGADTNAVRFQTGNLYYVPTPGEGENGIDWVAANDPRVPIVGPITGTFRSAKYATASTPIPLASGVEARLIVAEGDLRATGSQWLNILNELRTNGTFTVNGTDTTWNAGSGGVANLKPLHDPGTAVGRVDLLFRERAFWLYLTGHRHGDLRRLIRHYNRREAQVFPVGVYSVGSLRTPFYGTGVVFTPGTIELDNPLYKGCIDTNA